MKKIICVISILLCNLLSKAEVKRIQATRFDRSQVKRVYLAPGLGSMVLFPCALVEVFVGRSEDLRVQVSPNDKKTLFLNLKLNSSLPTNLIAKCDGEKSVYVFDVIPSKSKHQDVVEIRSSFGGPSYEGLKPYEVSTSKSKKRILMKAPALVGKGAVK